MCETGRAPEPVPWNFDVNLENDFNQQTLELLPDYEGEVVATLVSSKSNTGNRKSVLYLHGYVDYFFQPHLCEHFIEQEFDFYALDIRKHGRSIRAHQHANYCRDLDESHEEISIAIRKMRSASDGPIYLLGHSTGGLIASRYMACGAEKSEVQGLILNSPFLSFNLSSFKKAAAYLVAKIVSAPLPYSKLEGGLSPAYAESVHKDFHGEWDFNLEWKPIAGFPTYFEWIVAVTEAQKQLPSADIGVPILVMHSSRSLQLEAFSEEAMSADIVLNVEDIRRIGVQLGQRVTLVEIENGMHDLFLSAREVREVAFREMFAWLGTHGGSACKTA